MSGASATAAPPGQGATGHVTAGQVAPSGHVNRVVFIGSVVGVVAVAVWAIAAPTQAAEVLGVAVGWVAGGLGWFYIALATAVLAFVVYVAASRYGSVRMGPDHSRPEFSTFAWAAMLFAAGIGTDLMFFSVAEPVTQYLAPPVGDGGTVTAAKDAVVWTMFHYGITGWGMYSLMGMALGYFAYRLGLPLAVRSALYPIFGRRLEGPLGHGVDIAAVLGTIFGVATSLGIGVVQLNFGLHLLFGVEEGLTAQIALTVIAVVMATVSATTGVDRGIRVLSQLNVLLAILLTAWVLFFGDTKFLFNAAVMSVGDFASSFPGLTLETFAHRAPDQWMASWTLFFWAWWIAWASFVGMFLARISRGRTLRQFVTGTLLIPFSYIVMWVTIFGNAALHRVIGGDSAFGELAMNTPERGFYTLLQDYPGATFLIGLATFVGLLFYVTSADSGALVMANLSSRLTSADEDGKPWLRIVWAAVTGLLTIAVLIVGGVTALQNATVVMGLPFAIVMVLVMVGLLRALRVEGRRADAVGHRVPRLLPARAGAGAPGGGAAGSGRPGAESVAGAVWKDRLARALEMTDDKDALSYLRRIAAPSLEQVAAELTARGVPADVERGEEHVELRTQGEDTQVFCYRVELDRAPVPAYGGRMVKGRDTYARLEVHLTSGGQEYDVMGYSSAQLIHDVLDQYEQHLEFLRLESATP